MSTALLVSFKQIYIYIKKRADRIHKCIQLVFTNDVSPRDSQDDKILPEHIKINLKLKYFFKIFK